MEPLARENPQVIIVQRELARIHHNFAVLQQGTGHHTEAAENHLRAIAIQMVLARNNPDVPIIQRELAGSYRYLARLQGLTGQSAEAERSYGRAIAICEPLAQKHRASVPYSDHLLEMYTDLGHLQRTTSHPAEALKTWQKAEALLASFPQPSAKDLYRLARIRSLCSAVLEKEPNRQAADDPRQSQVYADQAVDALRRAIGAGWSDLSSMEENPDLDVLRLRNDFQALLSLMRERSRPATP
jgi:tetratricopeptide (TPR) repeat protein